MEHEYQQIKKRFNDLSGHRFGKLLAIKPLGRRNGQTHFLFKCDCGDEVPIAGVHVTSGRQKTCGCGHRQVHHGRSRAPEYQIWRHMVARCTNPKNIGYRLYGGRGIKVCDRWLDSVDNFIADMGHRPSKRHSVDRRENDGPYAAWNCYWALPKEQGRNRRGLRVITFQGKTASASEWAEAVGLKYTTLLRRLKKGIPPKEALTKPCGYYRKSAA